MAAPCADYEGVHAIRPNGGLVHIRGARPADLPALRALHAAASDRSIYLRFFSPSRSAADEYAAAIVSPNSRDHQSLVACVRDVIVGVATFERVDEISAEFALIVVDNQQHERIGTLLLEHLASVARHDGVHRFTADVLSDSEVMIRVLQDLGFTATSTRDCGTVHVEFPLYPTLSVEAAGSVRIAALVNEIGEIAELDLNPVMCRTSDAVVVDACIKVAPLTPHPDPFVRQLRAVAYQKGN